MYHRSLTALALTVAVCAHTQLRAAPPTPVVAYYREIPTALKEAKTLGVPALVVLTKPKVTPTALADLRVVRASRALACASVPHTAALAKQYELGDDETVLVLNPEGTVVDKFAPDVTAEKLLGTMNKLAAAARAEHLKGLKPDSDANAKKTALAGLARLGHRAEDLIPLLTDTDAATKETARKALAALPADAAMTPLLDALKSESAELRTAVHPLAVQATGYKASPLKVWQTGTAEERAQAWDKWNDTVQTQSPPLNRAVLAFCEGSMGTQVNNGECAMLVVDAFKECKAKPMTNSGETYIWGRALKAGEPVLPGDIVQYEGAKFSNGTNAPHHTAVIRKVLAAGKYETLEQNVNGVKKVQPGKLELALLKEGTVVIYRPQPK